MAIAQKNIFVVDDNDTNLVACKSVLKPFYVVYTIPSAAKMFDLLKHVKPDLILLDVEMPDMDGYEAARKLKNDDAFKNIPLIFLSGRVDPESEKEGLSLGALEFIQKPIVTNHLISRLEKHLSGTI